MKKTDKEEIIITETKGIDESLPIITQKQFDVMKGNYEALLKFTVDLLSHEQHVKFASKKKEIFG